LREDGILTSYSNVVEDRSKSPPMLPAQVPHGSLLLAEYNDADAAQPDPQWADSLRDLLEKPPAWADLHEIELGPRKLASVPVGPTLLLGMGGSALGARAALQMAAVAGEVPHTVRILDTVDPGTVRPALDWAQQRKAALHVVSKSGGTVEVLELLEACLDRKIGPIVLVSGSREGPMPSLIRDRGADFVHFNVPEDVGGRYSVLTSVGQVPLHAAGLSAGALVEGARDYLERARTSPDEAPCTAELAWHDRHPAGALVLLCYSDALHGWAEWLQQLWCESLGRLRDDGSRVGELVTVLRGPAAQHSVAQLLLHGPQDKRVVIADLDGTSVAADLSALSQLGAIEREATFDSLTLPSQRMLLRPELRSLGALMVHGMLTTVIRALHLGVSPYGQPAVEAIKRRIKERLQGEGRHGESS
jgi:glucose-6-phosphate isomerase